MARKEQDRGRQESKSRAASRPGAAKAAAAAPASSTPAPVPRGGKDKGRAGVVIASCACVSEYQDGRYGKGMRVFNKGSGNSSCTVCGAKRSV